MKVSRFILAKMQKGSVNSNNEKIEDAPAGT
jgi:hypothetical protein